MTEQATTPGAKWRAEGKPDPHGDRYQTERAKLAYGHLTDDEIANAVYLDPSIGHLTAAKDRIRWLSRQLEQAITAEQFKEWVAACHREVRTATGYFDECRRLATKLLELDVPEAWREPVRVMAQGGYYYAADAWMESAGGKTERAGAKHDVPWPVSED